MPPNAIRQISLTLYGNSVEGLTFTVGETVQWNLTLQDPATRAPLDLTSANVVLSFCDLDVSQMPGQPPLVSRQADIIGDPTAGIAQAMFASGDTAPTPATALAPKAYGLDIYLTDVDGNRLQTMLFALVTLLPAAGLPGTPITPLPAQEPLAQGPTGPTGATGPTGPQPPLSSATPQALGVADAGVGTSASRDDHVHPTELPAQSGQAGKVLGTNGSIVGWVTGSSGGGGGATGFINVLDPTYGAKGDCLTLLDAAMGADSTTLTSASAAFTDADVGKLIRVQDAGGPSPSALATTIATFVDAHTITLTAPNSSGGPLVGMKFMYGTDDAPAFQAAIDAVIAADGGAVYAPAVPASYLWATAMSCVNIAVMRLIGDGARVVIGLDQAFNDGLVVGNVGVFEMSGFSFRSDINVIGSGSRPGRVFALGGTTASVHHCAFNDMFAVQDVVSMGPINGHIANCSVHGSHCSGASSGVFASNYSTVFDRLSFIDGNVNGSSAWISLSQQSGPTYDAAGAHPFTIRNCSFDEVGGNHHILCAPTGGLRVSRVEIIDCDGLGNNIGAAYDIRDCDDLLIDNCALVTRGVTTAISLQNVARTTMRRMRSQLPAPNNGEFIVEADSACSLFRIIDSAIDNLASQAATTIIENGATRVVQVPAATLAANLLVKLDAANPGRYVACATSDAVASVVGVTAKGTAKATTVAMPVPAPGAIASPSYFYILTAKNGQGGILTEWRGDGGAFLGPPWFPVNFQGAADAAAVAAIAAGVIAAQSSPGVFDATAINVGSDLFVQATVEGVEYERETIGFIAVSPVMGGSTFVHVGLLWGQVYPVQIDGAAAIAIGDKLSRSTLTSGRAAKVTTGAYLGTAVSASSATAGALVSILWGGGTLP